MTRIADPREGSEVQSVSHWEEWYREANVDTEEWLMPYGAVAQYLDPCFLGFDGGLDNLRYFVVGCGLSALGRELHDAHAAVLSEVLSVDNSPASVERQQVLCAGRPKMRFEVRDMQHNQPDLADKYDVVVDKCVLDAVLATTAEPEKTACAMVYEVVRLLKKTLTAVYVVISLAGPERIMPFLVPGAGGPQLFASVEHIQIPGSAAACAAGANSSRHMPSFLYLARGPAVALHSMQEGGEVAIFESFVSAALQQKYTVAMPLLTPAREEIIRSAFALAAGPEGKLALIARDAYKAMFSQKEIVEYPFEDFLSDLADFRCAHTKVMTGPLTKVEHTKEPFVRSSEEGKSLGFGVAHLDGTSQESDSDEVMGEAHATGKQADLPSLTFDECLMFLRAMQ